MQNPFVYRPRTARHPGIQKTHHMQHHFREIIVRRVVHPVYRRSPLSKTQIIFTDGSVFRKTGRSGIGVYFGLNDPRNISEFVGGRDTDSNYVEMLAIKRALQQMNEWQCPDNIEIRTDSQAAINNILRRVKTTQHTRLHEALWYELNQRQPESVFFTWVKSHTGRLDGNCCADTLAKMGANSKRATRASRKK